MEKMNPEVKQKWIAALRSGKYKQGTSWLRTNKGYCCLGVLSDLLGASWESKGANENGFSVYSCSIAGSSTTGMLSQPAKEASYLAKKAEDMLARMNDDLGKSFNEIADWIEENL
jgi:hypothetical protein